MSKNFSRARLVGLLLTAPCMIVVGLASAQDQPPSALPSGDVSSAASSVQPLPALPPADMPTPSALPALPSRDVPLATPPLAVVDPSSSWRERPFLIGLQGLRFGTYTLALGTTIEYSPLEALALSVSGGYGTAGAYGKASVKGRAVVQRTASFQTAISFGVAYMVVEYRDQIYSGWLDHANSTKIEWHPLTIGGLEAGCDVRLKNGLSVSAHGGFGGFLAKKGAQCSSSSPNSSCQQSLDDQRFAIYSGLLLGYAFGL